MRSRTGCKRCSSTGCSLLLLISITRVWSGADDLTSAGTVGASLRLAVPIAMAGLGGIYAERSGVVNIALEGMLVLGTWFGAASRSASSSACSGR